MENLKIPNHVGIILDGNGRWAVNRGMKRQDGHLAGFNNLKDLLPYIYKKGVKVVSIYVFSTENFKRSKEEVDFLMNLFITKIPTLLNDCIKEGIKIVFSSNTSFLPKKVVDMINTVVSKTKTNDKCILNVCLSYGSRLEIVDATKKIINDYENKKIKIEDINEKMFGNYLYNQLPDIDLLIRTSGEYRISNFMLWQISYAELYFPQVHFPDFNALEFDKALIEYTKRDRRFGGINEKKSN